MKKCKILHLRSSEFFGSPEKLIIGQMKYLDEFELLAASFVKKNSTNAFLEKVKSHNFKAIQIEDNFLFDPFIPARIAKILREYDIDLLISHEYKSALYGHLALLNMHIPHISYFHGWTQENYRIKFYNFLANKALKRANKIVTVSGNFKKALTLKGISNANISVVYNALETNGIVKVTRDKKRVPVLGVVGRLSYEKGVHILLKAIRLIKDIKSEFKIAIIGDGGEMKRLVNETKGYHLENIVEFKGFQSDMDSVYKNIDILVIPSISEGHPLVILEAWSYNLAIIATKAGGIPEIIDHGQNGYLVEVNDEVQLARAIEYAIKNQAEFIEMGERGYRKLHDKYTFKSQARELSSIYRSVLGGE